MIFAEASALDHVIDNYVWHFTEEPVWHFSIPLGKYGNFEFFSKYALLMFLVAGLILWIYLPLAKKIQTGQAPTGKFWNLFEAILTFIRDDIAKPYIGKDADKYVHYLWTVFLFVLFCNLFGMVPFLGSPTASFTVTSVLAFTVFIFIHGYSIAQFGWKNHLLSFAPHLDMPLWARFLLYLMLWPIEFFGLALKCFVLSVRLFANMFAGHIVLGTILLFIPLVRNMGEPLEGTVTVASVLGVLALSFLELFVAVLQAYLFAFLTALFFGGVLEHAEHAAHAGEPEHNHEAHPQKEPPDAGTDDIHPHPRAMGHSH